MKWFFLALRIGLGGLFLYAGLVKASASAQFAVTLAPFTILPEAALPFVAVGLPWAEMVAGLLILWGRTRKIGAGAIFALCLLFCAILGWALANGIIVACSCFGGDETPSAAKMINVMIRDVFLALAAAAVFFEEEIRRRLAGNRDRPRKTPENA